MTRKVLLTTLGIAALALAAPSALANQPRGASSAESVVSPEHPDFWNYESGSKVADSSPGVPPQDLAALFSGSTADIPGSVTATDREIEWSQIGIGLGFGLLLALGVGLTVRVGRDRPIVY